MAGTKSIRPLVDAVVEAMLSARSLVDSYSDLTSLMPHNPEERDAAAQVSNLVWCVKQRVDQVDAAWEALESVLNWAKLMDRALSHSEFTGQVYVDPAQPPGEHQFPRDREPNPLSQKLRSAKAARDSLDTTDLEAVKASAARLMREAGDRVEKAQKAKAKAGTGAAAPSGG